MEHFLTVVYSHTHHAIHHPQQSVHEQRDRRHSSNSSVADVHTTLVSPAESAMSIVTVRLTVPSDDLVIGQILRDDSVERIELERFVPFGELVAPYFWVETTDPPSFEEQARTDGRLRTLERISATANTYLYRVEWESTSNGFLNALRAHNLAVERAQGTNEEWQFQLRGPDHGNISDFRETLRTYGVSCSVQSVWKPEVSNGNMHGLTDKQLTAVRLAFENGYFAVPKETNLSELAESVDISRQSFSRRLDRALNSILSNTIADSATCADYAVEQ